MGRHFLGDSFIVHSSFLVAAELYKMVVVFPQVVPLESPVNENGCWNWWGYLNDTHAMEYGKPEIQALSHHTGLAAVLSL